MTEVKIPACLSQRSWSKLFTEEGKLKYFVGVAELAKRAGVSPSAIRRQISAELRDRLGKATTGVDVKK
jgi:hypothetical protein